MKKMILFCALASLLVLTSCATMGHMKTVGELYPKMYQNHPRSIVIMPPINHTVNVEAKEYFYTSLAKPLCDKGYYVFSPFLAMDLMKSESAYDSELFLKGSVAPFRKVFGADAALFTIIKRWQKSALLSTITVELDYILKSTETNEILFERSGIVTKDLNDYNSSGSGLSALLNTVTTMVATALTDKVYVARACNQYVLEDLPAGPYSSEYQTDKDSDASVPNLEITIP